MKISQKIASAIDQNRDFWSFEYFPPKTESGKANLYDRMDRMYSLGPEFVDVTWNAGGTSSDVTIEVCTTAQAVYGLETCMHLTCTNMPRAKIDIALKEAKAAGIQNILALRGDPPRGQENWTSIDTGFSYGLDLVKYIRQEYGDYFCIGVAGYPEGHPDNLDKEIDIDYLKQKQDAGADYIVTQLFYDTDLYLNWLVKIKDYGITIPVLPGMMPIQNYNGFLRMTSLSKTIVPQFIYDALEPIKDDDLAVKDYGVQLCVEMCQKIRNAGGRGFHFYTLNLERSTKLILAKLGFVPDRETVKKLPWNQSLAVNREKENVRPIFWRNRPKSYIQRTDSWDEFPNGRWGDSRSPAFGDIDGYGVALKYPASECLTMWNHPESVQDIAQLFGQYCRGELKSLPWSDSPLQQESSVLRDKLITANLSGFLTINSQPAVDGAPSSDKTFGWGPKAGFVFQKAYLEFFMSPTLIEPLMKEIEKQPYLTVYAVSKSGDLITNSKDSPNAVTWGIFPDHEVVQPTIVESASFMAWKDEAFELWAQWKLLYDGESKSAKTIQNVENTWYLVNIVDNNFKREFEIFDLLEQVKRAVQVDH